MAHEVFISYAAADKAIADAVCKALEDAGIHCWYAPRDVPYGAIWEEAIIEAISESLLMILVLSSHANKSQQVKREVGNACAEESQTSVIPFLIENVPLNRTLTFYLRSLHWLDASTPPLEGHLQLLVKHAQGRLLARKEQGEQRDAEERRKRAEEEAERQRLDEEAARRAAEERERLEEEARERQEAETQRLREEAERQRVLEETAQREAEEQAHRQAEDERKRREAEAAAQRAEEKERQRREEEERQRETARLRAIEEDAGNLGDGVFDGWRAEEEASQRTAQEKVSLRTVQAPRRKRDERPKLEAEEVKRGGEQQQSNSVSVDMKKIVAAQAQRSPESNTSAVAQLFALFRGKSMVIRILVVVWIGLAASAVVISIVLIYRAVGAEQVANVNQATAQKEQEENKLAQEPDVPTSTPDNSNVSPTPAKPSPTRTPDNSNIIDVKPPLIPTGTPDNSNVGPTPAKPSPTSTPDNSNMAMPQKKYITPLRVVETPEGSHVTITANAPLNDFSAYRSGNHFFVVIPEADVPRLASASRGRGFDDVQMQKRGTDLILSFRLQPGVTARVDQKFNRVEIIFTAP